MTLCKSLALSELFSICHKARGQSGWFFSTLIFFYSCRGSGSDRLKDKNQLYEKILVRVEHHVGQEIQRELMFLDHIFGQGLALICDLEPAANLTHAQPDPLCCPAPGPLLPAPGSLGLPALACPAPWVILHWLQK